MLFIVIIVIVGIIIFDTSNREAITTAKIIDTISGYGYVIDDNDTKLFKKKFYELKDVLSHDEVDDLEYSKLVAELFIIDFFTLDNKISKNDVGGVQFVYSNYKASFVDKARDEFYKYVDNNLNGDRNQELPVVSIVYIDSAKNISLEDILNSEEFENINKAYAIELSWEYEEDLGYQDEATIIVIEDENNKFSVAKLDDKD